jgi:hypothetical protein
MAITGRYIFLRLPGPELLPPCTNLSNPILRRENQIPKKLKRLEPIIPTIKPKPISSPKTTRLSVLQTILILGFIPLNWSIEKIKQPWCVGVLFLKMAIAKFGCDCPGCRNMAMQLLQSTNPAFPR